MPRIAVPEGITTKVFILDDDALPQIPELLRELWPGKTPWIIADGNTWRAAGEKVQRIVSAAGIAAQEPHILPAVPKPHPDHAVSCRLAGMMTENTVPLAVGSGVINDLVKTAAGIKGITYCCIPTAPSVDGYTSRGAAMSVNGFKVTVPCPAPAAVVADKSVLLSAPAEMAAAGYGDLAAKVVAGADWLIADALGLDPVRPEIWDIVQKNLRAWLADHRDRMAVFMGLAATGYAMQRCLDSRPASGAEHLCSHIWEMEGLTCGGEEVSHGFKVAVGSVASLRLMQFFLTTSREEARRLAAPLLTTEEREKEIAGLLARGCYGDDPARIALEKFQTGAAGVSRREAIWAVWDPLREKVARQLGDQEAFVHSLKDAGCPAAPEEIGLDKAQFIHGIFAAQLIRKRYTILDLLYDAGLLHTAVEKAF
ncbi:MAG: sn-glycerol-1-phosphate dehydrogenase [Lentisphaeria bacterium]|nr:sn-glycerol-1-phosphate dehydrogenase [Lentisphaeria bacterium]